MALPLRQARTATLVVEKINYAAPAEIALIFDGAKFQDDSAELELEWSDVREASEP